VSQADPRNVPDRTLSLQVVSHLDSVADVLEGFERLRHPQLPADVWAEGQTALVEGFTNAVRHAHRDLSPPPPVAIELSLCPDRLSIQIDDHGRSFDMEDAWRRLSEQLARSDYDPLEREAHWGLVMLLRLQRDRGWTITYRRRNDSGNRLSISHRIQLGESGARSAA
jgi:serine/threonine-protein kinase RsbW